ncbi:MAG: PHP domain-containing protein [Candidatus Aenigmarchaeota archaeon]|nr:PHP domain-containing protein [Candidatus Aenigmarchaeota archaeon]
MARLLKMDLHLHSSHSFDARAEPKALVLQARKQGLDVIAVTDHGTVAGALAARKLAPQGLQVIVGQETKTKQGDLLILGVEEDAPQGEDILRTCRWARERGGLVVVPHPFDPFRRLEGLDRLRGLVDAVEGFNPKCFFARSNRKAQEWAAAHSLPVLANSDAHRAEDVGKAYSLAAGEPLAAIRAGKVSMAGGGHAKSLLLQRQLRKRLGRKQQA